MIKNKLNCPTKLLNNLIENCVVVSDNRIQLDQRTECKNEESVMKIEMLEN